MLLELENCNFIRSLVMHKYEWLTCQTEINSTLANYKYIWFSKPFLWEHAESPKRTTQRNLSLPGIVDGVLLCHPLPFRQTLYHWQNIHTTKMHHSTPTDRAIKFVYEYNATIKGIHCTSLIQGSSSASFFLRIIGALPRLIDEVHSPLFPLLPFSPWFCGCTNTTNFLILFIYIYWSESASKYLLTWNVILLQAIFSIRGQCFCQKGDHVSASVALHCTAY